MFLFWELGPVASNIVDVDIKRILHDKVDWPSFNTHLETIKYLL